MGHLSLLEKEVIIKSRPESLFHVIRLIKSHIYENDKDDKHLNLSKCFSKNKNFTTTVLEIMSTQKTMNKCRAYDSSACPLREPAPGGAGPTHPCIHPPAPSGVQPSLCPPSFQWSGRREAVKMSREEGNRKRRKSERHPHQTTCRLRRSAGCLRCTRIHVQLCRSRHQ